MQLTFVRVSHFVSGVFNDARVLIYQGVSTCFFLCVCSRYSHNAGDSLFLTGWYVIYFFSRRPRHMAAIYGISATLQAILKDCTLYLLAWHGLHAQELTVNRH